MPDDDSMRRTQDPGGTVGRKLIRGLVVPVVLIGGLSACGGEAAADACDGPISGTVKFSSSSVPPPFHQEWVLEIAPETSVLTLSPGYDSLQDWETSFTTDPDAVSQWCSKVIDLGDRGDIPSGSGALFAEFNLANAEHIRLTVSSNAPFPVGTIIPEQNWNEVKEQFEDWQAQYAAQ